jgi:outer membrane protein
LLSEEQLANARRQLEQSNQLLEQTDKLIRAGALPVNDRLEILSQVAMNEQSVVQAQNAVESNYSVPQAIPRTGSHPGVDRGAPSD